ncbi:hypothetical protein EV128_11915 [Rhizobium azibense]|nr:hypothetical protein EV128_11915 [Rhizobium azibense]
MRTLWSVGRKLLSHVVIDNDFDQVLHIDQWLG